jgi:hypothetical protein
MSPSWISLTSPPPAAIWRTRSTGIRRHAASCLAERVVVQDAWGNRLGRQLPPRQIPVTDVQRSRDWYGQVLGFIQEIGFVEDCMVVGPALRHPRQR